MSRVKQEIDRTQAGGRIAGNCTYIGPTERFQNWLGHFFEDKQENFIILPMHWIQKYK